MCARSVCEYVFTRMWKNWVGYLLAVESDMKQSSNEVEESQKSAVLGFSKANEGTWIRSGETVGWE